MELNVVIMAAGKGTRMRSAHPKVLHRLAGRSLLQHVLGAAGALGAERTVVVTGHGAAQVEQAAAAPGRAFVRQEPQLGTGHALQQAAPRLGDDGTTLVLNGDVPLIDSETLRRLVEASAGMRLALLTVELAEPHGYGRIVRGSGLRDGDDERDGITAIVEEKDANAAQRALREVYTGAMAAPTRALKRWLAALRNDNAAGEYYLTDVVALARADGARCVAVEAPEAECRGVNTRAELAGAEAAVQDALRLRAMENGATLVRPGSVTFSHDTRLGADVTVEPDVVFGPGVVVEDGACVRAFSHLEGCMVRRGAVVGPFARLRPGTTVERGAHVGNFVEIKNTLLGEGAKANHLSYLGDARIGAGANIGAGTITCNYDGCSKHRTEIGEGAFVGSDAALVAPVRVGARAVVGAGSVITTDVPDDALAIARGRQVNKAGRGTASRRKGS